MGLELKSHRPPPTLYLLHGLIILYILNKRYNWQSYNFEKYGLPVETPPKGKLLLYPIQVIWLFCCDNLVIWSSFPTGEYRGRAHQPGDVWDIPWLQRDCQGSGRKNWSDSWEINNLAFRDLKWADHANGYDYVVSWVNQFITVLFGLNMLCHWGSLYRVLSQSISRKFLAANCSDRLHASLAAFRNS